MKLPLIIVASGLIYLGAGCANSTPTVTPTPNPEQSTEAPATWLAQTDAGNTFTLEFPTPPTITSERIPIQDTELAFTSTSYQTQYRDNLFSLGVYAYPPEFSGGTIDEQLQALADSLINVSGGTAIESKISDYKQGRALNYTIEAPNGFVLKGVAVSDGITLYQLLYAHSPASYNAEDYERFVNSFSLKNSNE